jgi:hypothetical protein
MAGGYGSIDFEDHFVFVATVFTDVGTPSFGVIDGSVDGVSVRGVDTTDVDAQEAKLFLDLANFDVECLAEFNDGLIEGFPAIAAIGPKEFVG